MPIYRLYTYDVWGNAEDGWDVNDVSRTADTLEIPDEAGEHEILQRMFNEGLISAVYEFRIDQNCDWGDVFYIERSNGRPAGELRKEQ